MIEHDDRDLRKGFDALRREDAARTPPFGATLAAARSRPVLSSRRRALVLAAAAALTGVALALVLGPPRRERGRPRIDLATVHWNSPTDFLLRLPGDALLRVVPTLGSTTSTLNWRIP